MFGQIRRKMAQDRAVNTITENLSIQLAPYIRSGVLIGAIQNNAYIAGYIQGKILSSISYLVKTDGLATEDANLVSGLILLNLFGRDQAIRVSQLIKSHIANKSGPYEEGKRKGSTIVAYAMGAMDITRDPDYSKALNAIPRADKADRYQAVAGLEEIWFTNALERS